MHKHTPNLIRNVAIVAHIDHGKTTIMDALLAESNVYRTNESVETRAMDSHSLEKERGITIFSKHTSLHFGDYKLNLIDTPGHADFSGEVERVLGMVNSVLLLIDAQEGPMPQTRFVLSKALSMGLQPIVVLNKIDRPHANPEEALNKTFDLFVELGATDEQLDFAYCYASGLGGFAMKAIDDERKDMQPLFEVIIENVPSPEGDESLPFLMQASTLSYDDFIGRQATGRILAGSIKKNDTFALTTAEGKTTRHKVAKIEGYLGLKRIELEEAFVGDIVVISGAPDVTIGDTITSPDAVKTLPPISLGEPTLSIQVTVNSGPYAGKDGKHVTISKIKERLFKEQRANITLGITELPTGDAIEVAGRGELHLAILLETLRREGFELCISKPTVITKVIDGVKNEPFEIVHVEAPEEFSGSVIEELSRRKGELRHLETNEHGVTTMEFFMPTRGLMGYRGEFLTTTKGEGVLTTLFDSFAPMKKDIPSRKKGALVSLTQGKATGYAIWQIQERGTLFLGAGDDVYEGMVVGENSRTNDMTVNITKEKQLTNVRASGTDESISLIPPKKLSLEQAIEFLEEDELAEITPNSIRIRKRVLKESERKRKKSS